jgi:mannose-1-phosphate guanylyltransferase
MKIIIFAGGTGKRFWPASRKHSPKQFQPIVDNKPLVRVKYEYLRLGFPPEDIYLSTGIQYEKEARAILPELPEDNFIFEPVMRDNGPAVAYAVAYVEQRHPGAVISTQWSDHHIKNPAVFIDALKKAETIVDKENITAIIGAPVRFASPHRGYIQYGGEYLSAEKSAEIALNEFVKFVEKPNLELANEYLKSGEFSWNLGYFVFKSEQVMKKYKEFAQQTHDVIMSIAEGNFSKNVQEKFASLPKQSFDYIYAENLAPSEAIVINVEMGWSDVGEWISLKEALAENPQANVFNGEVIDLGSRDTLVYNTEPKKVVATINLDGLVIVNTPDVVAVFHKDDNGKIKEFLQQLENTEHEKYL